VRAIFDVVCGDCTFQVEEEDPQEGDARERERGRD
jgi:hypothetical protein